MSFHNKLIFTELFGSLPSNILHIHKQQSHQVHHGPFTAAVMVPQVSGASELVPSDLKRSTTSRQFSSVMSQHMVYCITITGVLVFRKLLNVLHSRKEAS